MRFIVLCSVLLCHSRLLFGAPDYFDASSCTLGADLVREIRGYREIVDNIVRTVKSGSFKWKLYTELVDFTDKFGNRKSGSESLEKSIDFLINKLNKLGLDNVHGEDVVVPDWVRGHESATILKPRFWRMNILGLAGSVSTPKDGITAEVVAVRSFAELDNLPDFQVAGKIVVFVQKWIDYHTSVKYRREGASAAAKKGAVAALIKSITSHSINTPHTGQQDYEPGVKKIPVACITVEDAEYILRVYNRHEPIVITLKMENEERSPKISRNTIADIKGRTQDHKMVIVSGHIDSWDVGHGALDDGGGAFVSWMSLHLLKILGLRPQRTLRSVLWTSEEPGLIGAAAYKLRHSYENGDITLLMESDEGLYKALGLNFAGSRDASCILHEILQLLNRIGATRLLRSDKVSSDIELWKDTSVPRASILTQNDQYFIYHHTDGDSVLVQNQNDMDDCLITYATVAYIVADLSVDLPRF